MGARLVKQRRRPLRLRRAEVGLGQEVADAPQTKGGRPAVEQRGAQLDGLKVAAIGDEGLQLDEARLRVVSRSRRLGQEELDRLAGAARDVLESWKRRPGPASLDEVDCRSGHVTFSQLGEAQPGFRTGLFDRARTEVDAGEPSPFGLHVSRNWCVSPPASHRVSLYTKS